MKIVPISLTLLWTVVPYYPIVAYQPSFLVAVHHHQARRTRQSKSGASTTTTTSTNAPPSTTRTALKDSRRDVLTLTTAAALGGLVFHPSLAVAKTNKRGGGGAAADPDYKAVARDIMALVAADPDKGPTLVRLAWHSSGTYDKMANDGGSGPGTIRFAEELAHGGNAGLGGTAVSWLEAVHAKHPAVSYADLYTLAGVASIKAMGGPTIPWRAGRIDAPSPDGAVTPDGRLPNADSGPVGADRADADHLRAIFYRMGFNDQEIVALSGAHALGRCHPTASGYDGPWTPTPTTFNNAYYTLLLNLKWVPKKWDGPYQYVDASTGRLMMLPTDLVLLQDDGFVPYVKQYGADAAKFDEDFTKAFQKLEELGTSNLYAVEWA